MKKEEEEEIYVINSVRFSMISGGFKLRVVKHAMWPCSVLVYCIKVYANFSTKVLLPECYTEAEHSQLAHAVDHPHCSRG